MKLIKSIVINKIGHFKWIYIIQHKNPSVNLRFKDICFNFMSIRFPVLTITAAKLNFIWFHWNQSIVFETHPGFKNQFTIFVGFNMVLLKLIWFQNGILGQKWLKMRFQNLRDLSDKMITTWFLSALRNLTSNPRCSCGFFYQFFSELLITSKSFLLFHQAEQYKFGISKTLPLCPSVFIAYSFVLTSHTYCSITGGYDTPGIAWI